MLVARLPGVAQSSIVDLSLTEINPKMILGTDSLALEYRIGFNDKMNLGRVHFFTFLFVIIDIKAYSIND